MKNLIFLILTGFVVLPFHATAQSDTFFYEQWDISNLEEIGGHAVTIFGDPVVVATDLGDAVEFDGVEDQLLVDFNPLVDAKEFTIELVFWPAASYPDYTEPRFVHIQDPEDPEGKRVMMELRINANNHGSLDGFMKTDRGGLTPIDESLVQPTETWHHAAITFSDSTFTTWFNGLKELSGTCRYSESMVNPAGKTSLGARMNQVAHFSGRIKTLKISHACLEPEQFLSIWDTTGTTNQDVNSTNRGSIRLFPNPVDGDIHLRFSAVKGYSGGLIRIYDLGGKALIEKELPKGAENPFKVDTSNLPAGIYTLSYESYGLIDFRKFVILH